MSEQLKYDPHTKKVYSREEYVTDAYAGLPNVSMLDEIYDSLQNVHIGFDSSTATLLHIKRVNQLLIYAASELLQRGIHHDQSKLEGAEKELFDKYTPKLKGTTYGSDDYKKLLKELKPSLDNHYAENSHHPEHYENGVNGMNLFDIVEMFFDWKAATERHADGDINKSITLNKERFNLDPQLVDIFKNTVASLPKEI